MGVAAASLILDAKAIGVDCIGGGAVFAGSSGLAVDYALVKPRSSNTTCELGGTRAIAVGLVGDRPRGPSAPRLP